jgi:hypothetical protein
VTGDPLAKWLLEKGSVRAFKGCGRPVEKAKALLGKIPTNPFYLIDMI